MTDHTNQLRHMIEVRPSGLDRAAVEWALAEIARLQEAKRRALAIADERVIEANGVRAENERLRERVAELQAECGYTESIKTVENERLRTALKPFAEVGASKWVSLDKLAALKPEYFHAAHRAVEQRVEGEK